MIAGGYGEEAGSQAIRNKELNVGRALPLTRTTCRISELAVPMNFGYLMVKLNKWSGMYNIHVLVINIDNHLFRGVLPMEV